MILAASIIVIYVVMGTVFSLFGYRAALEGAFLIPGFDQNAGDFNTFMMLALIIALAFAAAAVLIILMLPSGVNMGIAMLASAVTTGVIGLGMMGWFSGLTSALPIVMAAGGVICASTANMLGMFEQGGANRG